MISGNNRRKTFRLTYKLRGAVSIVTIERRPAVREKNYLCSCYFCLGGTNKYSGGSSITNFPLIFPRTPMIRNKKFEINVVDLRSSPRFVVHVVYLLGFFNSRIFSPWPHNLQGLFYEDIESCNRLLMRPFEKQGNRNASGHLDG